MRTRTYPWLLPAVLILFLTQVVLFPFAMGFTYAGRNESPHHVLTYTTGSLTWNSATGVDPDTGVAELSLFSDHYQNVQSDNGEKVVAPGTENTNIVRLKNSVSRTITYVAVMYRIKEETALPVEPTLLDDEAFTNTDTYPLPDGVTQDQVVRAVTGTVDGGQIQDFDIHWQWNYYDSDQRDQVDTALGNEAAWVEADEVTAGLYIVVMEDEDPGDPDPEDPDPENPDPENPDPENSDPENPDPENPDPENPDPEDPGDPGEPDQPYIPPEVPKTGDNSHPTLYLTLMAISGVVLVLLLWDRRQEKKRCACGKGSGGDCRSF